MGLALNRTNANTIYTWLTAANNQANMRAYSSTEIAAIPNTNSGGELTAATHHQLKLLYRANLYEQANIVTFDF